MMIVVVVENIYKAPLVKKTSEVRSAMIVAALNNV